MELKNQELQEIEIQEEQSQPQKKTKRHGARALIALCLAFVLIIGSSFAYFSDYATQSATGTAGTLSIALESDINLLDANGMDILNPGDIRTGSFTVTNMGNKSADIRTTIALTAYDRNGDPIDLEGSATTQSMYDLYLANDVEFIDGQGNIPKQGVQPLQTKNVNGNVITYSIPEYSLNGNSDLYDEVEKIVDPYAIAPLSMNIWTVTGTETVIPGEDQPPVVTPTPDYSHSNDFVLVFNTQAGNEWQGSVIQIDIIVEAKQHENTGAGWQLVEHQDLVVGSLNQGVVVPENVITTNGVINPGYEYTPGSGTGSGSGDGSSSSESCSVRGVLFVDESGDDIPIKLYTQDGNTCIATIDCEWIELDDKGYTTCEWHFEFANLQPNTNYVLWFDEDGYFDSTYEFTTSGAGSITVLDLNII